MVHHCPCFFFLLVVVLKGGSFFTNSWVRGDDSGEGGRRMKIVGGWKVFNSGYVGRD